MQAVITASGSGMCFLLLIPRLVAPGLGALLRFKFSNRRRSLESLLELDC